MAAGGARFHVAIADDGQAESGAGGRPLVLLVHGFPEYWWAWRHQLPALAAAGYRAAALDLRGYGGSDKTPRGYDPMTLAGDLVGVVKGLGHRDAVLVGQGWGGYVAWAATALHRDHVRALCAVTAPHPLAMIDALRRGRGQSAAIAHLLAMQVPIAPERRIIADDAAYVETHLHRWAASTSQFPDEEAAARYRDAMRVWPAPHCALEYHRWLLRSRLRTDGRRFGELMRDPVGQPVLEVYGAEDPVIAPAMQEASRSRVRGPWRGETMTGVGHFPHEEDPRRFTDLLLDWLAALPRTSPG